MADRPLTVVTVPKNVALTTVARVHSETGSVTDKATTERIILRATSEVERLLNYPLGRALYTDRFIGVGLREQALHVQPLKEIVAVRWDGDVQDLTNIEIQSEQGGIIINPSVFHGHRRTPYEWDFWPDNATRKYWEVDYWGGWLLPTDDLLDVTDASASSVDDSFNLASGSFPYCRPDDRVTVTGFGDSANNGMHTVRTRDSDLKITVDSTLVTEGVPSPAIATCFEFANVPGAIEHAAIVLAHQGLNFAKFTGDGLFTSSKKVGDLSIGFSERKERVQLVKALLSPYRRIDV